MRSRSLLTVALIFCIAGTWSPALLHAQEAPPAPVLPPRPLNHGFPPVRRNANPAARIPAGTWGDPTLIDKTPFTLPDDINLSPPHAARWEPLSPRILHITSDPSGKLWYQLNAVTMPPTLDQAKQWIAREFTQPQPQFSWLRPILFQKSGRVWFLLNAEGAPNSPLRSACFLGYDGKTFIEHPVPQDTGYGNGLVLNGDPNITRLAQEIDGRCFFASSDSVSVCDGKDWLTRELSMNYDHPLPVELYPEPDHKGLLVVGGSLGNLWRWRDGKWKAVHYSADRALRVPRFPNGAAPAHGAAPVADGVWLVDGPDLRFVKWESHDLSMSALIAQLDSDKYAEREAATKQLTDIGRPALDELQNAAGSAVDEESKSRLNEIISQISDPEATTRYSKFGPYFISAPLFLFSLPDGSVLLGAGGIGDEHKAPATSLPANILPPSDDIQEKVIARGGVLRMEPDGHVHLLGGEELLAVFRGSRASHSNLDDEPLFLPDSTTAWLTGSPRDMHPALVDLRSGKVLANGPHESLQSLQAASADGTLLFRTYSRAFYAYHPGAPDTRSPLPVIASMEADLTCQTGDGATWGIDAKGNVSRFDGKSLRKVLQGLDTHDLGSFTPGTDTLVYEEQAVWHLAAGSDNLSDDSLEDLIAAHPERFAHFNTPIGNLNYPLRDARTIEADAAGNVWLLNNRKSSLQVFTAGKWIDATDALIAAGIQDGQVSELVPIGTGSALYLRTLRRTPTGPANDGFLVSLQAGQIHLTPSTGFRGSIAPALVLPDHSFWTYAVNSSLGTGTASRISDIAPIDTIPDFQPLVADAHGDLWGIDPRHMPMAAPLPRGYIVIHAGKRRTIPSALSNFGMRGLFPAANGHLYTQVDLGIGELVAADAETADSQANGIAHVYSIPALPAGYGLLGIAPGSNIARFQVGTTISEFVGSSLVAHAGSPVTYFVQLPEK